MSCAPSPSIYEICSAAEWRAATALGAFEGSNADGQDGFIHFSVARQLPETLARHFAGISGLALVEVEAAHG